MMRRIVGPGLAESATVCTLAEAKDAAVARPIRITVRERDQVVFMSAKMKRAAGICLFDMMKVDQQCTSEIEPIRWEV